MYRVLFLSQDSECYPDVPQIWEEKVGVVTSSIQSSEVFQGLLCILEFTGRQEL